MPLFIPSNREIVEQVYGAAEAEEAESTTSTADILAEYAPAVSSLLFSGDPRVKYEKKKASLQNYIRMYERAPNKLLKNLYASKINSLQAEIKALGEQAGEERAAVALTQTGKISGILLLGAGVVTTLMVGNYFYQKSKTEKQLRIQPRA